MFQIQIFLICIISIIVFFSSIRHFPPLKEFIINKYLKLKLEGGRTNVYVNNRLFRQCMYLLLNIPVNKIEDYNEIQSIDEAATKLDRSMERDHRKVPPETEFWGHCSNIQAWVDNEYDTRILHRNLAFPLLKALVDAGDPIAKQKFKEEIAIRYATGHPTVIRFLTQNGYLHYLTEDEFESMLIDINFPSIDEYSRKIIPLLSKAEDPQALTQIKQSTSNFISRFRFKYKYLILLKAVEKIPNSSKQKFVKIIYNKYKSNRSFPLLKFLDKAHINFSNLEINMISYNEMLIGVIVDSKVNLKNKLIENIENVKGLEEKSDNIEELDLSNNRITEIKGLENLKNLKKLSLRDNYIERINGLENLHNLEFLDLSGNINIEEIPEMLNLLPNLKTVKLTGCQIKTFSKSVSHFFWMGQNFRTYAEYNQEDIIYYEKTHKSKASNGGRLYKNFVKWLFKLRSIMDKHNFNYIDINNFEQRSEFKAFHSGKPTKLFLKYLFDRCQMKMPDFF
ncbi:MAG: leucine-rich repeat domain-containing protein [Promethearchaeota archaeon]|nr:MAG: leucine-rich repeat domain-containing protein [Candidatus Lokiarchaeota archaeon]